MFFISAHKKTSTHSYCNSRGKDRHWQAHLDRPTHRQ